MSSLLSKRKRFIFKNKYLDEILIILMNLKQQTKSERILHSILELNEEEKILNDTTIDTVSQFVFNLQDTSNIFYISSLVVMRIANNYNNSDAQMVLRALGMKKYKIEDILQKDALLFVLNEDVHWSLLVYFPTLNAFFHYNSLKGMNDDLADSILNILKRIGISNDKTKIYNPTFIYQQSEMEECWSCGFQVLSFIHLLKINEFKTPISRNQIYNDIVEYYEQFIIRKSLLRKYLIVKLNESYVN